MSRFLTRYRFQLQAGYDAAAWFVGLWVATFLRYEFRPSKVDLAGWAAVGVVAVVAQIVIGRGVGLYVHRWRYGTFEEAVGAIKSVAIVTPLVLAANLLLGHHLPVQDATVSAGLVTLAVMAAGRFAFRVKLDEWNRAHHVGREPVIVFGAGDAGLRIVSSMLGSGPFHPVAVLDDARDLQNLRVRGIQVSGDRNAIAETARRTGATSIVIAIPSASGEVIRKLAGLADEAGLTTLVLPSVEELFGSTVNVGQIRPLTEADLGRREITLDIESVAGYLTGKRVLVTGAGGSIGSELCRQIHRFAPGSLVMLDRDESALQAVQLSIEGRGLLDSRELVVSCIRDIDRLAEVFEEHHPEVIFHAAALKHLPLLEMHPGEGWKTNVWGTANLLDLAGEHGVERFVNISTDKAADPVSVLGRTKRLAEQLTAHAGARHDGTYLSVRFGNVLGSRGSVLPLFREQIELGGPVTVTDPGVTRYFMTIPEACELVIQAGALGERGEVLVLDMGEPVRIADLAKRLIQESSRPIEIVYTGLRPGEKLDEVLFGPDEEHRDSGHPLISRVDVPPLSPADVEDLDPARSARVIELRVLPVTPASDGSEVGTGTQA